MLTENMSIISKYGSVALDFVKISGYLIFDLI